MISRIGRLVFLVVVGVGLTLAAPARASGGGEPLLATATVRQDFSELYQRLQAAHFDLFARRSKSQYDALFKTMSAGMRRPMTRLDAAKQFQRFVAYGNVAHANIDFASKAFAAYRDAGGLAMPLSIRIIRGNVYITRDYSGDTLVAPGDQIVSLNNKPVAAVLAALTARLSADNTYLAHTMLETSFANLLWQELGSVAAFDLTVRSADGQLRQVRIQARARDTMRAVAAKQGAGQGRDLQTRAAEIAPHGVAYLRPGAFYNIDEGATDPYDSRAFAAFLEQAFARFAVAGCTSLLIDLRDNPGGDNSFSDLMVNWFADRPYRFASRFEIKVSAESLAGNRQRLEQAATQDGAISQRLARAYQGRKASERFMFDIPLAQPREPERFRGKVVMLVNRHSYSNAVMVAALAQDYKFATIAGEETADLASTYGAMEQFPLSRTGITVNFPKARITRPSGNTDARGVLPDHPIEMPLIDTQVDPALEHAFAIARRIQ